MVSIDYPLLYWGFILLTLVTLLAFYWITGKNPKWLAVGIGWLALTAFLARSDFFLVTDALPPRIAFVMLPMLIAGLMVGFGQLGKSLRDAASLEHLHYFHGIRIIVEIVFLHGLFETGFLARTLTYAGLNFDLLPGILLPLVGWLAIRRGWLSSSWAVAANILGILILGWTVVVAILSAPTPYQQFSPEQPTIAIFYFPFVWLPALVAPLMFWAHFISLCLLLSEKLREKRSNTGKAETPPC